MNSAEFFDQHSEPIDQRLATGLYKIGLAVKHQERQQAFEAGLSATQSQILTLLSVEGDQTASDVARVLGLSLASVSESVSALLAKELLVRRPSPSHHRASLLRLTKTGLRAARQAESWPDFLAAGIGTLSEEQQENLLSILMSLLRTLQDEGRIPTQRMCVNCTFFRPNVHAGARPHHCAFVDAPMRPSHLRLACDEHTAASDETIAEQWRQLVGPAVARSTTPQLSPGKET